MNGDRSDEKDLVYTVEKVLAPGLLLSGLRTSVSLGDDDGPWYDETGMAMNDRDSAYTDKVLGDALRMVTGGIDPDLASETCADALAALAKQAKALRDISYTSDKMKRVECACGASVEVPLPNFVELSKAMAQTAKMIDETARLAQFMGGKADSRPELAGMPVDVLKALTDAQLAQVMGWVEANGREAESISERGASA